MAEIRQAAAAARLRLKAAHCGVMGGQATDGVPVQVPQTLTVSQTQPVPQTPPSVRRLFI